MPKRPRLIAERDVPKFFGDDFIARVATRSKLPSDADVERFGRAIRDAVLIYLRDVAVPNHNVIHREIAKLHQAAHNLRYAKTAKSWRIVSRNAAVLE
jgi:hypothetical protein